VRYNEDPTRLERRFACSRHPPHKGREENCAVLSHLHPLQNKDFAPDAKHIHSGPNQVY